VPEHFLATLYGLCALALGASVWSAMAVIFGPWSLPAAPAMGWLIGWACRHGGRRMDSLIRATAWLLALLGALIALFAFCAFSVTQTSPDAGFQSRVVGLEYLRLFSEPPWFGSAALLLVLAGAWRALGDRNRSRPRAAASPVTAPAGLTSPVGAAAGLGSGRKAKAGPTTPTVARRDFRAA